MMSRAIRTFSVSLAAVACFGSVLADAIKAPACLAVADSRGKIVGAVVQTGDPFVSGTILMSLEINGRIATVNADASGIGSGNSGNDVYFASTDCSGAPFIAEFESQYSPSPILPLTSVSAPGQTLYVQVQGSQLATITAGSSRTLGDPTCYPYGADVLAVQAAPLADLSTLVQPPLSVTDHGCQ